MKFFECKCSPFGERRFPTCSDHFFFLLGRFTQLSFLDISDYLQKSTSYYSVIFCKKHADIDSFREQSLIVPVLDCDCSWDFFEVFHG